MKDAKGHGSDAHQEGVSGLPANTFEAAKAESARLNSEVDRAGAVKNAFPRGPMGLTPDHVKASPEFRAASAAYNTAFQKLRQFNSSYVKTYAKELRAERIKRRGG